MNHAFRRIRDRVAGVHAGTAKRWLLRCFPETCWSTRVPGVVDRLGEDQIEILGTWGAGLATDTRAELRAAGKAIMMLVEEIERLQVEAQGARGASNAPLIGASNTEADQVPAEAASSHSLSTSLRERLGTVIPGRAAFEGGTINRSADRE
jgi:hypothetical protein